MSFTCHTGEILLAFRESVEGIGAMSNLAARQFSEPDQLHKELADGLMRNHETFLGVITSAYLKRAKQSQPCTSHKLE